MSAYASRFPSSSGGPEWNRRERKQEMDALRNIATDAASAPRMPLLCFCSQDRSLILPAKASECISFRSLQRVDPYKRSSRRLCALAQELHHQQNMSVEVLGYIILFIIGAPANFIVLRRLLCDGSYKKSRHLFLLLNLSLADAIVVFIMIPAEIGWKYTNTWVAGDIACKVFKFFAAFGTYSSSLLLISVSVDRYYAVVRPFAYAFLDRKMNFLLLGIWAFSFLISTPQVRKIMTHVSNHPNLGPNPPPVHECRQLQNKDVESTSLIC